MKPQEVAPAEEKESESKTAPTPTPRVVPMPKFRPAPMPIMRPARNFTEIEECKRTPAYITHGISLATATKVHQIGGVEKEQPNNGPDMPALF